MKKLKKESLLNVSSRVLGLISPHKKTLIVGLVALGVGSGINLIFPELVRQLINQNFGLTLEHDLLKVTVVLIFLFAVQACFFYVRHYCFQAVGYRIVSELRQKLFKSIIEQDVDFFDRSRVGDLLSRLSSDAQVVQRALTINISVAVRYIIQVIGGICFMFTISTRLTLLIILLIPLLVFSSMIWGKKLRKISRLMQDLIAESNVIAEESISLIRTVKIFAGIEHKIKHYNNAVNQSLAAGLDRTKVAAVFSSFMVFLLNAAIALIIYYGGTLVLADKLTLGDLTGFLLYCVLVAVSFGFIVNTWDEFLQAVGAAERIFEIIDQNPKVINSPTPKQLSTQTPPSIEFNEVNFSYPSRLEVPVLKNLNMKIPSGKTTALVGPSGSGKSTIAALICRFYDPESGIVKFDGIDLKDIELESLKNSISVVSQQPQVFSISIGDNIRYAKLDATEEEVLQAAKAANLYEFIQTLPEKFDSLIGDKGIQLSGGEKQRLAIARAVLKNPRLLILDEATSALDSQNEIMVQQSLNNLMKDRTTVVIAHRISTVQDAEQVVVIRNGSVIQVGTHHELMEADGLYRTLVEHQLLS